jgi:hypothetical protein
LNSSSGSNKAEDKNIKKSVLIKEEKDDDYSTELKVEEEYTSSLD